MREINFLTWNTQLYEMGNSINDEQPVKKIDMLTFNIVVEKVKKFLDSKNEAVAILQEIPFVFITITDTILVFHDFINNISILDPSL